MILNLALQSKLNYMNVNSIFHGMLLLKHMQGFNILTFFIFQELWNYFLVVVNDFLSYIFGRQILKKGWNENFGPCVRFSHIPLLVIMGVKEVIIGQHISRILEVFSSVIEHETLTLQEKQNNRIFWSFYRSFILF